METRLRAFLGALLLLACGCTTRSESKSKSGVRSSPPERMCTAIAVPGIVIDIRDSLTQQPLHGATLRIFSGGRVVDSAESLADRHAVTSLAGVYERPGTYDATVDRSGYRTWRKDTIRVVRDECHVTSVRLIANMRPTHRR